MVALIIMGIIFILIGGAVYFLANEQTGTIEYKVLDFLQDNSQGYYNSSSVQQADTMIIIAIGVMVLGVVFLLIGTIGQIASRNTRSENDANKSQQQTNEAPKPNISQSNVTQSVDVSQHSNTTSFDDINANKPEKKIAELFSPEIYGELKYVFGASMVEKIKYLPKIIEERDAWICVCGFENTTAQCLACGMELDAAREKLNYAYLAQHRNERLEQEKYRKRELFQKIFDLFKKFKNSAIAALKIIFSKENQGKAATAKNAIFKNISEKAKRAAEIASSKKNKPKVIISLMIVIIILGAMFYVTKTTDGQTRYLNIKASMTASTDIDKSYNLLMESIRIKPTVSAYKGLFETSLTQGNYVAAGNHLKEGLLLFPGNDIFSDLLREYTPVAPTASLKEGRYETLQQVEFSLVDTAYNAKVKYNLNEGLPSDGNGAIELNSKQTYTFDVWTENDFDLESTHATYQYIMDLPKPKNLEINLKSGNFDESQFVILTSPEKLEIYYTLDGSDPSRDSLFYNGPVEIGLGRTHLKAVCFNKYEIPSEYLSEVYQVTFEQHGTHFSNGYSYSGYLYDYFSDIDGILVYSKDGELIKKIESLSRCRFLNEYKDNLYYLTETTIQKINISNSTNEVVCNLKAFAMVLAHDYIYYVDAIDEYLYRVGLSGENKTLILKKKVNCLDVYQDKLYYNVIGEGVNYIESMNKPPIPTKLTGNIDSYFFYGDVIYYTWNGNLHMIRDGADTVIREAFDYLEQEERKLITDYHEYYSTWKYSGIQACKTHLYFREVYYSNTRTYNWVNKKETSSNSFTNYKWYQMDLETGQIDSTGIDTYDLYLTDNAIIYGEELTHINVYNGI
jgi:hypothetical protein